MQSSHFIYLGTLIIASFFTACKPNLQQSKEQYNKRSYSEQQKEYWFSGKAEITAYKLSQARYGELRKGTASVIFVTEPFSLAANTKSDSPRDEDQTVLKMITNKKFNTGIYPYSIMTSSFFPFFYGETSLKISTSTQEWCGMTYMEMQNNSKPTIKVDSYFEGEGFGPKPFAKAMFENDLISKYRLDPKSIVSGSIALIPDFSYLRMMHKETKAYKAELSINSNDSLNSLQINYPNLSRKVRYNFAKEYPYTLESWEDAYPSKGKMLTTKAVKHKRTIVDYWNKNAKKDEALRAALGL